MSEKYNPFDSMTFTYDRCFLCGELLDEENSSEEHVFPKWLQHKFNLWEKELTLLNRTNIKYKLLKIPCCKKCNNEYLSGKLEKKIKNAVDGGYEEFIKLDEKIIFQWLLKLSYGMLFKELSLNIDLRNPNNGKIITPELLKQFTTTYSLLQTVRFDTEFIRNPWSILIFKVKPEVENMYNAHDFIIQNCYFMRMNDIGIVANLQDGGYQKEFFIEHMEEFLNMELAEIQFSEICAKFLYKSSLYVKSPYFMFMFPNKEDEKCTIVTNGMNGNVFREWSQKEYAKYLEFLLHPWNIRMDKIYFSDDKVITYLYNDDGLINKIV